jgi:CubicO group peptidase (beta-lactamase class C family)
MPDARQLAPVMTLLERGVAERVFPGAVLGVGYRGARFTIGAGRLTYDAAAAAVTRETVYDLASLTKVVAATTAAMILADLGRLEIDRPVASYLPDFVPPFAAATEPLWSAREEVTVRHLLAHTSGLSAYEKFFLRARAKAHVIDEALAVPLEDPPGSRAVYSDIGFILLGAILERITEEPLDAFCRREIFGPLGLRSTCFNPPVEWRSRIAPTEQDDAFRKRLIVGEVQDENAWVMGGVAGHAGLFGTVGDLALFCQMMLEEGRVGSRELIRPETVREFTQAAPAPRGAPHSLGWARRSEPSSSGRYFSAAAYGHLGFTGTSIWIDPEKRLYVVLLTNRIYPSRENQKIRSFRPALHDAVVEALGA